METLFANWAEVDPLAAIASSQSDDNNEKRSLMFYSALNSWTAKDAEAAKAWALQLPPGTQRNKALRTVIQAMAETDPESAFSFAKMLPKDNMRDVYWSLFSTWASTDPATAAERAMSLPSGQGRENAFSVVASNWAEKDVN
ncbi:MAG: hypothetical protein ACXWBM_07825, partial [Chthoniobacterales bacterium]